MSKRFIDTEIWEKPWFMDLAPPEKMAVMYVMMKCDNVGVWKPNFKLAAFQIGSEVDWQLIIGKCNGNIEVLEDGKWWLVDFCAFQHGDLFGRKSSGALNSYMKLLEKHGLMDTVRQRFTNSCLTLQGEGEGKGKGKGTGKGEGIEKGVGGKPSKIFYNFDDSLWYGISDEQYALWADAYPAVDIDLDLRQAGEWCKSHGARGRKSDWKKFAVGWLKRTQDKGGNMPKEGGEWKSKRYSR